MFLSTKLRPIILRVSLNRCMRALLSRVYLTKPQAIPVLWQASIAAASIGSFDIK